MYFYVSDKEHNRYSFRSRGTLLLENMDSNYNRYNRMIIDYLYLVKNLQTKF